jgi:hypothetical protein
MRREKSLAIKVASFSFMVVTVRYVKETALAEMTTIHPADSSNKR